MANSLDGFNGGSRGRRVAARLLMALVAAGAIGAPMVIAVQDEKPVEATSGSPAADLAAIADRIDLKTLGTLAVLDRQGWRYTTVESWSRKVVKQVHGAQPLFGLDPVAAAMELLVNAPAYLDRPILYIKDLGLLQDITKHPIEVADDELDRMFDTKRVSYAFLTSPAVRARLGELGTDARKSTAMGRLSNAKGHFESLAELFAIVPDPQGVAESPWHSVLAVARGETNLTPEQAQAVVGAFRRFTQGWLERDTEEINAGIAALAEVLPPIAPEGIYPTPEARQAELQYRRMHLMKTAWVFYIFAFFASIFAVATRYRWARGVGLLLVLAAAGLHGYDLWLRWDVIGRVPVANMYEAIVSSTWVGVVVGLFLELVTKKRVFLLASAVLGFFALALPELLSDQIDNNLQTMMPILDDIMLRIHTVLIISSYAVITLAWAVANCYLFGAAFRERSALAQGTIGAQVGAIACLFMAYFGVFERSWGFLNPILGALGVSAPSTTLTLQFLPTLAATIAGGALLFRGLFVLEGGAAHLPSLNGSAFPVEKSRLEEFDFCHRVLLYIAAVSLFVGIVLGAVWADYSWGRPWGWDPKEVFALNTWLVYALIIHARFVTKRRALWTAVLSVLGFAAMQFNWWVVNFYIVGLHSYA